MHDIRGSKLLVIGGAGLIGSHIVEELIKEDVREIVVYDNFCRGTRENLNEALTDPRVRIYDVGGDVLQSDILGSAVKESDYVFHLAALWLRQCHEFPQAAFDVNIRGTFNVLEACRNAGVKRFVYSSSASVYGDAVEIPMTESHPFNNKTFYGATKIAGEAMCTAYGERYKLPFAGLRYMNVYGPRQDYHGAYIAVIMKILDRLDEGLPPILFGDGSQCYDFIHVSDVARANVLAMKATSLGQFYNVGSGIKTSLKELCGFILELTGSDQSIQFEKEGLTFVTQRVGCTKKAEEELGFSTQVDLRQGLRSLIQWRKGHQEYVRNRRDI